MAEKTVLGIIVNYLREKQFDGLYTNDCGCTIESFAPCCGDYSFCKPGVRITDCECGCDVHIGPRD